MKFQVGDRVFVHSHCYFENNYNAEGDGFRYSNSKNVTYICNEMLELCDKVVTITEVKDRKNYYSCYKIKEDEGEWDWDDWMFADRAIPKQVVGNSNIVKDLASILGIEVGQVITSIDTGIMYRLSEQSGLEEYTDSEWKPCFMSLISFLKMIKEYRSTYKWIPKNGDLVYYIDFCDGGYGDYYSSVIFNSSSDYHNLLLNCNMLYKTKEEAIEAAKKYMNKMKYE